MFEGKVAIVTGAASGIGRATALLFAERGARVVASDVNADGGAEAVQQIEERGGEAVFVLCDIAQPEQVRIMVDAAIERFGRLDFACNNAGVEGEQCPTIECSEENFDRIINVNLRGTWLCMKHEIPRMLETGGGSVVNVSSIAGLIGFAGIPAYVASKHGMNGLTKAAALEYAKQNIRVNAVCPGAILTPMIERFTHFEKAAGDDLAAKHPLGRMGRPEEVAEAIVWLCSDAASFVTGHIMAVDGGFTAQ